MLQSSFVELGRELIAIYCDSHVNAKNFTNQLFTEQNYRKSSLTILFLDRKHIENVELLKRAMLDDDLLDSDDLKDSDDDDDDDEVDDGSPIEGENETTPNIQSDAQVPEDDVEPEPVAKGKKNKKSKRVNMNFHSMEFILEILDIFGIVLSNGHINGFFNYCVNIIRDL